MTLATGTKLGPYEILSKLGAGGMGEVYRARDARLERDVAIKVLPDRFAQDHAALARFQRESKAVAALSHPNIRAIYDSGTDAGRTFAVMELLEGETLASRLKRSAFEWAKALPIALAIADGLAAAHGKGIIHRDIKPQNIFLTAERDVKILDFGLARLETKGSKESEGLTTTLTMETQPGAILGTIQYMSPEQVRGRPADARSDVFAFGCVLYEMLTGHRAFSRKTSADTIAAILNDDPPALTESGISVPAELQRVTTHCLERNAAQRFQTARDLAFALTGIARDACADEPAKRKTAHMESTQPSVAVLPFVNMSPDQENEYFSDGLAEELINALCKIQGLHVVSRTSAFAFKGKNQDVREIGKQLNVRTVLEGSVRRSGQRLRVTAQLVNTADGYHLWSETFDRQLNDVFEVQDEIANAIVRALRIVLSEQEKAAMAKPPTASIQAYDYYLRGRQFFNQQVKRGFERAREMFARALVLDPQYARAWAAVAECCACLCEMYYEETDDNLSEADAASKRALALDPQSPEAHVARGLALSLRKKYEEAVEQFEIAVQLDPNLFDAHYFGARTHRAQKNPAAAAVWFERAAAANPDDYQAPALLAGTYRGLGEAERAHDWHRRAREVIERHLKLHPDDARALCFGAGGMVALGEHDRALEWINRAEELEPREPRILYNVACVYANLGDKDRALDTLEASVDAGRGGREWMEIDPDFASLREHPRFQQLLTRL